MSQQRSDSHKQRMHLDQQYAAALKAKQAALDEERNKKFESIKVLKQQLEVSEVEQKQKLAEFEAQLKLHFEKNEHTVAKEAEEWRKNHAQEQLAQWEAKMHEFRQREAELERYKLDYEEQVCDTCFIRVSKA